MRFWPFYGFINMAKIPKNCIETKLFLDAFFLNLPHISGGTKWLILEVSFKEWKYRFCPFCASKNMAQIPKNCAEVDCTRLFLLSEIRGSILIILTLPITGGHKFSILTSKQSWKTIPFANNKHFISFKKMKFWTKSVSTCFSGISPIFQKPKNGWF